MLEFSRNGTYPKTSIYNGGGNRPGRYLREMRRGHPTAPSQGENLLAVFPIKSTGYIHVVE
jgi:hypothetical protein